MITNRGLTTANRKSWQPGGRGGEAPRERKHQQGKPAGAYYNSIINQILNPFNFFFNHSAKFLN